MKGPANNKLKLLYSCSILNLYSRPASKASSYKLSEQRSDLPPPTHYCNSQHQDSIIYVQIVFLVGWEPYPKALICHSYWEVVGQESLYDQPKTMHFKGKSQITINLHLLGGFNPVEKYAQVKSSNHPWLFRCELAVRNLRTNPWRSTWPSLPVAPKAWKCPCHSTPPGGWENSPKMWGSVSCHQQHLKTKPIQFVDGFFPKINWMMMFKKKLYMGKWLFNCLTIH